MKSIAGEIDTPALVLDASAFERNVSRMAEIAAAAGIQLRPHAKTHKSVEIARAQLKAGAVGICCAKLGEAEVLGDAGIQGLMITSPVVTANGIRRLVSLNQRVEGLSVVVDDLANLHGLVAELEDQDKPLRVLIDIDIGQERTGVRSHRQALELAAAIEACLHLQLVGVQGYAGHLMHVEDSDAREVLVKLAMTELQGYVMVLREQGHALPIVTGGGTGTFEFDIAAGVLSELQTGSYVFMDTQYREVQRPDGAQWPFEQALFVYTSVVSVNNDGWVTTDAGLKAFATDGPNPEVWSDELRGSDYAFFGDEHGMLIVEEGTPRPQLGELIVCAAPHCDPTVNLYSDYHLVRDGELLRTLPIDARGRSA